MKSEHRHELKTNELGRIATEWGRVVERFAQQHTYQLLTAALVVIIALIGLFVWRNSTGAADREGWRAILDAKSTSDFGTAADKYAGMPAGAWARLCEAEGEYSSALRLLFTDGSAGRSEMKKSEENFEKLVVDESASSDVHERALFGLARCREALPEKNVSASKINDRAIEAYDRLLKEFPDSMYKDVAEARIKALRTGTAQDFYAWFQTQNPKPADERELPKDLRLPPPPPSRGGSTSLKSDGQSPAADAGKAGTASQPSGSATASGPASNRPGPPSGDGGAAAAGSRPPAGPKLPAPAK